ncbi:Na-translocating system protein MpsC family protein [Brevibacillus brevis]|uniref:Na-translocating system protein MpsC family protein n=1 Tax=Brevibacillus brevis TaxID=1393 RepID=UPI00257053E2|nr:Na-translocating system protein MpsC family protein [Lysinibacillus sp. SDF0063]
MAGQHDGRRMVHDARTKLVKKIYTNPEVVTKLEDLTMAKIVRIFSDINIEEDIAMTVLVFDRPLDSK